MMIDKYKKTEHDKYVSDYKNTFCDKTVDDQAIHNLFCNSEVGTIFKLKNYMKEMFKSTEQDIQNQIENRYKDMLINYDFLKESCAKINFNCLKKYIEKLSLDDLPNDLMFKYDTEKLMISSQEKQRKTKNKVLEHNIENVYLKVRIFLSNMRYDKQNITDLIDLSKRLFSIEFFFKNELNENQKIKDKIRLCKKEILLFIKKQITIDMFINSTGNENFVKDLEIDDIFFPQETKTEFFFFIEPPVYKLKKISWKEQKYFCDLKDSLFATCIISYIILCQNTLCNENIQDLIFEIIDLRINFIKKVLSVDESKNKKPSFFRVFEYIENTSKIIEKFCLNENFSFISVIKNHVESLNVIDFLFFNDWIRTDEKVLQKTYDFGIDDRKLNLLNSDFNYLENFFSDYFSCFNESNCLKNIENATEYFLRLVIDLIKFCNYMSSLKTKKRSNLLNFLFNKDYNLISRLLSDLKSLIKKNFLIYLKQLYQNENSFYFNMTMKINSYNVNLQKRTENVDKFIFFKKIDKIYDDYMMKHFEHVFLKKFENWMSELTDCVLFLKSGKNLENLNLNFKDFLSQSNQLINSCSSEEQYFFFKDSELDSFLKFINNDIVQTMNDEFDVFLKKLNKIIDDDISIAGTYFLLFMTTILQEKLENLNLEKNELQHKNESLAIILLKKIFLILEKQFYVDIENYYQNLKLTSDDPCEINSASKLLTVFYKMTCFLSSCNNSGFNNFNQLFGNPWIKKIFLEIKNEWILKSLIENLILKIFQRSINQENYDNDKKKNLVSVFLNDVFFLLFVINDANNILIEKNFHKKNNHDSPFFLTTNEINLIKENSLKLYNKSKNLYIPLNF